MTETRTAPRIDEEAFRAAMDEEAEIPPIPHGPEVPPSEQEPYEPPRRGAPAGRVGAGAGYSTTLYAPIPEPSSYEPQVQQVWDARQVHQAQAEVHNWELIQEQKRQEQHAQQMQEQGLAAPTQMAQEPPPPAATTTRAAAARATPAALGLQPGELDQLITSLEQMPVRPEAPTAPPPLPGEAGVQVGLSPIESGAGRGFVGALEGLLAAPEALGLVSPESPTGQTLKQARAGLHQVSQETLFQTIGEGEPAFIDRLFEGVGSMTAFFAPGLGVAKGVSTLARFSTTFARLAGLTGAAVSAATEAATEAGSAYDNLVPLVGEDEASRRANKIGLANLALVFVSNKLGIFAEAGRGLTRFLAGAIGEGAQEAMQYDIERRAFSVPADHPAATRLQAEYGWTLDEASNQVYQPFQFKDATEAAAVGAILGGGAAVAVGAALEQPAATARELVGVDFLFNERGEIGKPQEVLPETKVTDEQGLPKRVFHGTPQAFEQFETARLDPEALYGPGIYFTESPEVAGGNLPARLSQEAQIRQMQISEIQRTLPTLRTTSPETAAETETRLTQLTTELETLQRGEPLPGMVQESGLGYAGRPVREGEPAPNVRPAYLDIRQPFDMDGTIPLAEAESLLATVGLEADEVRTLARDLGPAYQRAGDAGLAGQALYQVLVANTKGGKAAVTQVLKQAGYDGITHTGGAITGGQPHKVWIAFEPDQVKPAFGIMDMIRRLLGNERGAIGREQPDTPREAPQAAQAPQPSIINLSGMGAGISESLIDSMYSAALAGRTTEGGQPSTYLQVAKRIQDAGRVLDRESFKRIMYEVSHIRDTTSGAAYQQALGALVQRERAVQQTPHHAPQGQQGLQAAQGQAPRQPQGTVPPQQPPPPIGARAGSAQGMPLLDKHTQTLLGDFIRTLERDALQTEGKPFEINYDFIRAGADVKQVLAATSDLYQREIAAIRTPESREATRQQALAMGMSVQEFLNIPREELVSRKKAILGREMAVASARQLKIGTALFKEGKLSGDDLTRLFATHSAIQMQFARLAHEAGGALSTFAVDVEGQTESLKGYDKVVEYLGSSYTPEQLADLVDAIPTPEQLAVFAEKMPRVTLKDMLLEAWYGAMFSGTTLFKNVFGNAALLGEGYLLRVIGARLPGQAIGLAEATRRATLGEQKGLTLEQKQAGFAARTALFERDLVKGEANAFAYGMFHSFADAWAAMKSAARAGEVQTGEGSIPAAALGQRQRLPSGQVVRRPAITRANIRALGPIGRLAALPPFGWFFEGAGMLARVVSRGLVATDEFYKVLGVRAELHALAHRKAVMDTLSGEKTQDEIQAEMEAFLARPPEAAQALAEQRAAEMTLTQPFEQLGAFGRAAQGLENAANYSGLWRFFFPFVRIATNSVYWNLERFPLVGATMNQVRQDLKFGGARADMARAKLTLGLMSISTIAALTWAGLLRDEGGEEREERALSEAKGTRGYTFVVPGTTVQIPFKPVEPFGMFLGTIVEWTNAIKDSSHQPASVENLVHILAAGVVAFGKNIFNNSWTQNMMEMSDLLFDRGTADEREGRIRRFVNRLGRIPVPSVVRQVESIFDPEVAEVQNALDALLAGIPGVKKVPELDFWGDPRRVSTTGVGLELFVPFTPSVDKSLTYGEVTVEKLREAVSSRDMDRLKVYVSEEILAARIPVSRPSPVLLATQQGDLPQDKPIRLRPEALNELRTLFAKEVKDGQGRTLPEAIAATMLKREYLRGTDGENGSRALLVRGVVQAFKDQAEAEFMRKNRLPGAAHHEIIEQYQQSDIARKKYRYGVREPARPSLSR